MGRDLWSSADLTKQELGQAQECFFERAGFPETNDALKAAAEAVKLDQERPAAFANSTLPHAQLSVQEYTQRIDRWL